MDSIIVTGNGPLSGQIPIAGAKNACLTLMPATLLSDEPLTLTNAPRLSDIRTMSVLLQSLGAEVGELRTIVGGKMPAPKISRRPPLILRKSPGSAWSLAWATITGYME